MDQQEMFGAIERIDERTEWMTCEIKKVRKSQEQLEPRVSALEQFKAHLTGGAKFLLKAITLLGIIVGIIAAIAACGGGRGAYLTPGYIDYDKPMEGQRIVDHREYSNFYSWSRSPYFRVTIDVPSASPVFVLIDNRGMGCVVPADIWAMSPHRIKCPSKWRHPRR